MDRTMLSPTQTTTATTATTATTVTATCKHGLCRCTTTTTTTRRRPKRRPFAIWTTALSCLLLSCAHTHAFVLTTSTRHMSVSSSPLKRRQNGILKRSNNQSNNRVMPIPSTSYSSFALAALPFVPHDLVLALNDPHASVLETYGTLLRIYPLTTKSMTAALLAFVGDAIAQYSTILDQAQKEQAQRERQPLNRLLDMLSLQKRSEKHLNFQSILQQYDLPRGLTFLLFGGLYTGAFQHVWFTYMSAHVEHWGEVLGVWGPIQTHSLSVTAFNEAAALPEQPFEWWSYFDIVAQLENPPSPQLLAAAKVALNQFGIIPTVYMPLFFFITGGFNVEQAYQRAQALYTKLLVRNYVYWLPVQFGQFLLVPPEWQIPFISAASLVWTVILSRIGNNSTTSSEEQQQQQRVMSDAATVSHQDPQPVLANYIPAWVNDASRATVLAAAQAASTINPNNHVLREKLQIQQAQLQNEKDDSDNVASSSSSSDITEQVTLEDVRQALVPETLERLASNPKFNAAAAGLTMGLLASAADDAALGEVVSEVVHTILVTANVGGGAGAIASASAAESGQAVGTGVAVISGLGAGIGFLGALQDEKMLQQQQQQQHQKQEHEEEQHGNNEYSPLLEQQSTTDTTSPNTPENFMDAILDGHDSDGADKEHRVEDIQKQEDTKEKETLISGPR